MADHCCTDCPHAVTCADLAEAAYARVEEIAQESRQQFRNGPLANSEGEGGHGGHRGSERGCTGNSGEEA